MKKLGIFVIIILILGGFIYLSSMNSKVEPLGRLVFVKLANPDLYPGHPHPDLLPSREKELLVVIARPRFLRSWQSLKNNLYSFFSLWIKGD